MENRFASKWDRSTPSVTSPISRQITSDITSPVLKLRHVSGIALKRDHQHAATAHARFSQNYLDVQIRGNLTMVQTAAIVPFYPAPHCQIKDGVSRPATGMHGAASIVRPRGFRVCLLVFGLSTAFTFKVHPGVESKIKNASAVPSNQSGVAAVAIVTGARRGAFGCGGSHVS